MARKLYRNSKDKIIAGVCSGLGEYLNIDPVIIRIIALALFFMQGFGLLTYIIAWVIIPGDENYEINSVSPPKSREASGNTKIIIGVVMIVFGALIALDKSFYYTRFVSRFFSLSWEYFLPLALIVAGAFILMQGRKNSEEKDTTDFTK
jgi:phage shock protein C